MSQIAPPKYVRKVLRSLRSHGYAAYLVGGCVRDMLLQRRPNDWDVCTDALPAELLALFPQSRPTGLRHGTVTVILGGHSVEVTTFRTDGAYLDHRRPEQVRFVGDLSEDLSRRDFTMNAMALSDDGVLTDPFGGAADIRAGLIRCVGDPAQRFEEDALRMLRALRFSAKLGFSLDLITLEAIREKAALAAALSPERVKEELEKTLLSPAPETLYQMSELGLLDRYLRRRIPPEAPLSALSLLPRRRGERWMGLCLVLERHACVDSGAELLRALRLDKRSVQAAGDASRLLRAPLPEDAPGWKRLLRRYGVETVTAAVRCADALAGTERAAALRAVVKSGDCFSLKHLAVSGEDLLALGLQGRELGDALDFLLDYVIDYPANNRRELLLELARRDTED